MGVESTINSSDIITDEHASSLLYGKTVAGQKFYKRWIKRAGRLMAHVAGFSLGVGSAVSFAIIFTFGGYWFPVFVLLGGIVVISAVYANPLSRVFSMLFVTGLFNTLEINTLTRRLLANSYTLPHVVALLCHHQTRLTDIKERLEQQLSDKLIPNNTTNKRRLKYLTKLLNQLEGADELAELLKAHPSDYASQPEFVPLTQSLEKSLRRLVRSAKFNDNPLEAKTKTAGLEHSERVMLRQLHTHIAHINANPSFGHELLVKKGFILMLSPLAVLSGIGLGSFFFTHIFAAFTLVGISSAIAPWLAGPLALVVGVAYGLVMFKWIYDAVENNLLRRLFNSFKRILVPEFHINNELANKSTLQKILYWTLHITKCLLIILGFATLAALIMMVAYGSAGALIDACAHTFNYFVPVLASINIDVSKVIMAIFFITELVFNYLTSITALEMCYNAISDFLNDEPLKKITDHLRLWRNQPSKFFTDVISFALLAVMSVIIVSFLVAIAAIPAEGLRDDFTAMFSLQVTTTVYSFVGKGITFLGTIPETLCRLPYLAGDKDGERSYGAGIVGGIVATIEVCWDGINDCYYFLMDLVYRAVKWCGKQWGYESTAVDSSANETTDTNARITTELQSVPLLAEEVEPADKANKAEITKIVYSAETYPSLFKLKPQPSVPPELEWAQPQRPMRTSFRLEQ